MKTYNEVYSMLALPGAVRGCANGAIALPLIDVAVPAHWYGFPPALIPLWSSGSGPTYTGLWRHWFVERDPAYVTMYVGSGRLTVETARTAEQFLSMIALRSLSERDGLEADLIAFAEAVGLAHLQHIDAVSLATGDDPCGLIALDQFRESTPLESVVALADYTGAFPRPDFNAANAWWESTCSFEYSRETAAAWPADLPRPPWLVDAADKVGLFDAYLGKGDLGRAWLTLNSTGWTIARARAAIATLREHAQDRRFDVLVDAWLSIADENAGAY